MVQQRIDKDREQRIAMEIVVDAYDESERAMGWYCYLEDVLKFPFKAKCVNKKASSPLRVGQEIEALGLADPDECAHEIKVSIRWEDDDLRGDCPGSLSGKGFRFRWRARLGPGFSRRWSDASAGFYRRCLTLSSPGKTLLKRWY